MSIKLSPEKIFSKNKDSDTESGNDTFHSKTSFIESDYIPPIRSINHRQSQMGQFLSKANSNSQIRRSISGERISIFKSLSKEHDIKIEDDPFLK
jgi:hypothetical protein